MISLVSFAVVDTAEVSSNRNSSSRFISSPPRRLSEHFATLMSGSSGDAPRTYALWPRLAPYLAGESLEGTDAARSELATQFKVGLPVKRTWLLINLISLSCEQKCLVEAL